MSKIEKKIHELGSKNPDSKWKERIEYRRANKGWLRKSGRVALRVLAVLDEKGWSQAELARQLNVTPQQVTKYLKGQSDFKFSTIDKLEKVLGIQLQAILMSDEVVVKNEETQEAVTVHNYSPVSSLSVLQVSYKRDMPKDNSAKDFFNSESEYQEEM